MRPAPLLAALVLTGLATPSSAALPNCVRINDPVGDVSPAPLATDGDDVSRLTMTTDRGRLFMRFRLTAVPDTSGDVMGRSYGGAFFPDRGYLQLDGHLEDGRWTATAIYDPQGQPRSDSSRFVVLDGARASFDARTTTVTVSLPLVEVSYAMGRPLHFLTFQAASANSRVAVRDDVDGQGDLYVNGRPC